MGLNFYSRARLHERLHRGIVPSDLAKEFPIQWVEEVDRDGLLVDGPGLGYRGAWMHHDCSVATGCELSVADPTLASEDYMSGVQRTMAAALAEVENNESVQFMFFPWDESTNLFRRFSNQSKTSDSAFQAFWRKQMVQRETQRMASGDLRRFRSFMFLNVNPTAKVSNPFGISMGGMTELWGLLSPIVRYFSIIPESLDALNPNQYVMALKRATQRLQSMESLMASGGLVRTTPIRANDLFEILRRLWAPGRWNEERSEPEKRVLPDLDANSAPFGAYFLMEDVEDLGDTFRVGKTYHKILTMNTAPVGSDVGLVAFTLSSGALMREVNQMQVSLTLTPADKFVEMEKLRWRIRLLENQAGTGSEFADNQKIVQQYVDRRAELRTATRASMFLGHFQVHIWNESRETLDRWAQQVRSSLDTTLQMLVKTEEFNSLPYHVGFDTPGYTHLADRNRSHALVPVEAAVLAPIGMGGEGAVGRGDKDPVPLLLETDLGTPYGIDLFAPGLTTNFGGWGVGVPGSGKTNYYQRLVMANAGAMDIIIVDGADQPGFHNLVTMLGGLNIRFDDTFRVNPMSTRIVAGVQMNPDKDELDDMLITLGAMLRGTIPLKPLESAVISSAVRSAFEHRGGDTSRVGLDGFVRGLAAERFDSEQEKNLAIEFSRVIRETFLGRYRENFSGTEELPSNSIINFMVSDLMRPGQEQLRPVMISIIFRYIERQTRIKHDQKQRRRTLAIVDEAWKAVKNPAMVGQITALYRTGRARGISPHLLSQNFDDLRDLLALTADDPGAAGPKKYESSPVFTCSSHNFIFSVAESDAKQMKETFGLTNNQTEVLTRLSGGKKGEYRELVHMLKVSDGQGQGQAFIFSLLRSRILPEEYWAYTTNDADTNRRNEMQAQLAEDLNKPETRNRLVAELRIAGWEVSERTSDQILKQCVTVHRLARTKR